MSTDDVDTEEDIISTFFEGGKSIQNAKRPLIMHKHYSWRAFISEAFKEIIALVVLLVLSILWALLCSNLLSPKRFIHYNRDKLFVIPMISIVSITLALGIFFLLHLMYKKSKKYRTRVTLIGDAEVFSQPNKKKLEIKRVKDETMGKHSPSSSAYFSINGLPVVNHCPGLVCYLDKVLDKEHLPIPFTKWKQGQEADYLLKVTLVGDSGTGKTSFREVVSGNSFSSAYQRTFGVDFCSLYWEYQDLDTKYRFHITLWDTDGQYDQFSQHIHTSGQHANCVVLFYDVTRPETLLSTRDLYRRILEISLGKNVSNPPSFVVIANKVDKNKQWKQETDEEWVHKNLHSTIPLVPVSCAQGSGLANAAELIVLSASGALDYVSDE